MKPMTTKPTLLLLGGLAVSVAAGAADLRPLRVEHLTGNLHIYQDLPLTCNSHYQDVAVTQGRLEIGPGEDPVWENGKRVFVLIRGSVSFAPFEVHRSCAGRDVDRVYSAVDVQIVNTILFRAVPTTPGGALFDVTIPKEDVRLRQVTVVNGQSEIGEKTPKEDVTGTINLSSGDVTMVVKVATKIHVSGLGDYDGELTATLAGNIEFADYDEDGAWNMKDNCPLVPNPGGTPVASPVIRAPSDRTVNSCKVRTTGFPSTADLCWGGNVSVSSSPHNLVPGLNLVTWTAYDTHGNTATDVQQVTVVDQTPPRFLTVPPNVHLLSCGPANLGTPTGWDDCGTPTFTNNAPAVFNGGTTTVTWTAHDLAGNTATATQLVTVTDLVRPTVACQVSPDPDQHRDVLFTVTGADLPCTALPILTLGAYRLKSGETVKVTPSTTPGVVLLNPGEKGRKHFRIGPNENVILARDAANNTRSAVCALPHHGL
jgi:hypothetical protein